MRDQYDFSKGERNPYAAQLKKQVTINLDAETVDYFRQHRTERRRVRRCLFRHLCLQIS